MMGIIFLNSDSKQNGNKNKKDKKPKSTNKIALGGGALFLAYVGIFFTNPPILFDSIQFDFYVHCPVSYELQHLQ